MTPPGPHIQDNARPWFWRFFWATLILKLLLSAVFPITGDEALFVQWGKRPDWGYYDHPPMIGWWLALVMPAGDSLWLIRALTVLTTHIIALGIVDWLQRRQSDPGTPWLAASLYLLLPWTWMFFLVTTDTPVVLFMALATWCLLRGLAKGNTGWFWVAGTALGMAFLSKYFAVLLGLGFAAAVLVDGRQRVMRLLALTSPGLLCAAYNLGFNATHGWPNIMFNLFARQDDSGWNPQSPLIYLLMMGYLLTPWLVWWAMRPQTRSTTDTAPPKHAAVMVLWVVPLAIFGLISLRREIGLHWVLGFIPMFVAWAALRVRILQLQRAIRYTLWLDLPHLMLVLALLVWPLDSIRSDSFRAKVAFFRHSADISRQATRTLPADAVLMGTGYSTAAILAYHYGQYVPVFGMGSKYARQDDLWTDFKALHGRTIRIFERSGIDIEAYAPFFETVSSTRFEHMGLTYFVVDGQGFRYDIYKQLVLDEIHRRYFRIPPVLPVWGNPFCERYGYKDCAPDRSSGGPGR